MKEGSTAVAKWTDHMYKTTEWMCKVKEGVDIRRGRIMLAGREARMGQQRAQRTRSDPLTVLMG